MFKSAFCLFVLSHTAITGGQIKVGDVVRAPKAAIELLIQGPDEAQPGDLVVLDGSGSQGVTSLDWDVSPAKAKGRTLVVENGKKLVFATSLPGFYQFFMAGGSADGKVKITSKEVKIGNPTPGPTPPGPTPPGPTPPGPTPPDPPGPDPFVIKYNLDAWVVAQVGKITDPYKATNAIQFANACDAVVSQIGAGVLKTDEDVANAFKAQLKNIGFFTRALWVPLLPALNDQKNKLGLDTPEEWTQALKEMSIGLRKVQEW